MEQRVETQLRASCSSDGSLSSSSFSQGDKVEGPFRPTRAISTSYRNRSVRKSDFSRLASVYGWLQVAAIETDVSETDIFASSTCNFDIISLDQMKKLQLDTAPSYTRCGAHHLGPGTCSSLTCQG